MFTLVWILVLVQIRRTIAGYIEIVQAEGCETCRLMLTCRHLDSVVAILEVNFTPDLANDTILGNSTVTPSLFPPVHPRDCLNQRCSGVNHCSFILEEDCSGSEFLGPGALSVKYACVTQDRIKKYCNSEIALSGNFGSGISEGFIHNPGYPRFYSGLRECRWRITAPVQQKIRLTVLDVALIVDTASSEEECADILQVKDTGQVIYSSCGQEHPPAEVMSGSDSVEVVLKSRQIFNPRRGFLIHYSAVGCLTPNIPQDAYLVHRTDDVAIFSCCVGYFFPDTSTRTKTIGCLGAYWNVSLPLLDCQKLPSPQVVNQTRGILIKTADANNMSELLAPIIIMSLLFLVNGGILYFIYKAKEKQADEIRDEELGAITSPVRGI